MYLLFLHDSPTAKHAIRFELLWSFFREATLFLCAIDKKTHTN